MKKRIMIGFLTLALAMSMSIPALAAGGKTFQIKKDDAVIEVTFSDIISEGEKYYYGFVGANIIPLTVPVGTTIRVNGAAKTYITDSTGMEDYTSLFPATQVDTDGKVYDYVATTPGERYQFDWIAEDCFFITVVDGEASPLPSYTDGVTDGTVVSDSLTNQEQVQQPVQNVAPEGTTAADKYTVQKWDTLGQIALNWYGSYGYHQALYRANAEAFNKTGGKLVPGMTLTLPENLSGATRLTAISAAEGETLYTVKAGDTLGGIAKSVYGEVMKYQAIYERNSDRLKNADTIYAGQVIVLPAK